jgi:zinc transporter ZupT
MTAALTVSIIIATMLGIIHFWNEKFILTGNIRQLSVSLVAGIAVAYSFTFLLPDVSARADHFGSSLYIILLAGFVTVHVLEKFAYKHFHGESDGWRFSYSLVHFWVLFVYYIIIGSVLYLIAQTDLAESILFSIPLAFYAAVGVVSFEEVHAEVRYRSLFRWLLASATLIGVFLAELTSINEVSAYHALFAFAVGGFIYITLIDLIPARDKGTPFYFALGAILYTGIILLVS